MAALTEFPAALFFSMAALNGLESTPSLSSAYSAPTEMHWLSRLRRARMYMGTGTLFCVTLPALMRYGMGVRMCAPSMPLPAEPSTRLSRVVPQEACLVTSTSGMPYLAKSPFSLATISGAESVSAMNPSTALVVSGIAMAAYSGFGIAAAMPPAAAAAAADLITSRRENLRLRCSLIVVLLPSDSPCLFKASAVPATETRKCARRASRRDRAHQIDSGWEGGVRGMGTFPICRERGRVARAAGAHL